MGIFLDKIETSEMKMTNFSLTLLFLTALSSVHVEGLSKKPFLRMARKRALMVDSGPWSETPWLRYKSPWITWTGQPLGFAMDNEKSDFENGKTAGLQEDEDSWSTSDKGESHDKLKRKSNLPAHVRISRRSNLPVHMRMTRSSYDVPLPQTKVSRAEILNLLNKLFF